MPCVPAACRGSRAAHDAPGSPVQPPRGAPIEPAAEFRGGVAPAESGGGAAPAALEEGQVPPPLPLRQPLNPASETDKQRLEMLVSIHYSISDLKTIKNIVTNYYKIRLS